MISKNERPFTRVVVEKPIGHDYASAKDINDRLAKHFEEDQVFRIDHYLGKETVENLMVLRFANAIFEPLWNAKFIDHVQITVAESEGVGTRAGYYEHAGALRDMVQSHLLQVLSLLAMEPPRTTEANSVRDSKLDVLRTLRPFTREDVDKWVVRGQYTEGLIQGQHVKGYRQEEHVAPDSNVETFVALKCFIENWRWAGVPFYLRTGKRLPKRASEIAIQFNSVPRILFNSRAARSAGAQSAQHPDSTRGGTRVEHHFENAGLGPAAGAGQGRFPSAERLARGLRNPAARHFARRSDPVHEA